MYQVNNATYSNKIRANITSQAQISEYKFEIERLAREMQDMKKRYFEQKKREQLARGDSQRV